MDPQSGADGSALGISDISTIGSTVASTTGQVLNEITAYNKGALYNPQTHTATSTNYSNYLVLGLVVIGGIILLKFLV